MPPARLTIDQAHKLSPKILLHIINRAKKHLKNDDTMKELCAKYDLDTSILDFIPIKFADLKVSAQTNHGVIILNYKLLCEGDFFNNYSYIIHEMQHYLQQCYGEKPTQGANDGDYLSNPAEQEGFQYQIKYLADTYDKQLAEDYTDHLLDHHDKKNTDREEKKEILMELVDE